MGHRMPTTGFLRLNRALCRACDRIWPYPLAKTFWESYNTRAAELARNAKPQKVVDLGAGRTTPYAMSLDDTIAIIGIDILPDDLATNKALTVRVVHDFVSLGIPSDALDAGLVTSRMVLEHVPNLAHIANDIARVTSPGGRTLHLFAARFSAFATLNRLLPNTLSRRLLFTLRPESAEVGGFPTYYDCTYASAAKSIFEQAGFEIVQTSVSYQISQYFHFFFPLFLLARLWETLLHIVGQKDLGSFVLLEARLPLSQ
jgi:ubiquinone/menaquinone biosynthesis C-methylase UbiE